MSEDEEEEVSSEAMKEEVENQFMVACIAVETGSDCSRLGRELLLKAFYAIPQPRVSFLEWAQAIGYSKFIDLEQEKRNANSAALSMMGGK